MESAAVIDHEGKLVFRVRGYLPLLEIRAAVEKAIADIPPAEPVIESAVVPQSWGGIKAAAPRP